MKKRYRIEFEFEVDSTSTAFTEGDPHAFLAGLITGLVDGAVKRLDRPETRIVDWKYISSKVLK
jgi:hypothetical protein